MRNSSKLRDKVVLFMSDLNTNIVSDYTFYRASRFVPRESIIVQPYKYFLDRKYFLLFIYYKVISLRNRIEIYLIELIYAYY
jgi:hypothetical protein